jgi:hypothetical protein
VGASLLAKAVVQSMKMLAVPTPSRASPFPQDFSQNARFAYSTKPVGASLLAKAVVQAMKMLAVPTPSRASPLPQDFS